MSTACEHVYAKVARAAIEAGKRRRDLALTVAATSASSGSSGKRSNKSMEPTPSTHVTPEPKQSHTETPTVEPRALEFENAGTTGGGGNTTPDLFDVLWQVSCKHQLVFTSLRFTFWIRLLLRQVPVGGNGVDEPEMIPEDTLVDPSTFDPHLHQVPRSRNHMNLQYTMRFLVV